MRIGIDARELCGRPTGVGRYLGGLLSQWAVDDDARRHEFVLYAPEAPWPSPSTPAGFATRIVPGPRRHLVGAGPAAARRRDGPSRRAVCAGVHGAARCARPTVVAIHDLSFVAHPEWFRPARRHPAALADAASARKARAVITISEFSRRELVERLGVAGRTDSRHSARGSTDSARHDGPGRSHTDPQRPVRRVRSSTVATCRI